MASLKLVDNMGNEFELNDLSDYQLYQLLNLSKLAEHHGINRYTFAARCCRSTSFYRSLVTALKMGKPQ